MMHQDSLFNASWKNRELSSVANNDWIWDHCSQTYAYQEYSKVLDAIERGEVYRPTDIPQCCM